ncbi:hypothetical protein NBRC116188_19110 [Oceaniserpentilla sp. 4NH20-0058]
MTIKHGGDSGTNKTNSSKLIEGIWLTKSPYVSSKYNYTHYANQTYKSDFAEELYKGIVGL